LSATERQVSQASRDEPSLTRRRLLASGLLGACSGVLSPARAAYSLPTAKRSVATQPAYAPMQQHYVSRPDLTPQLITIDRPANALDSDDLIFLAPYSGPPQWGPMIIDGSGELVWFRSIGAGSTKAANLGVQTYRGQPVLTWWEGTETSLGYGLGDYLLIDSSYHQVARVKAANGLRGDHHAFHLTPEGSALFTIFRQTHTDLSAVGGPKHGGLLESVIQEIDISSGRLLFQWNSLDHVSITESYRSYYGPYWDYMHANSVDLDDDGNLLISARNMHAIYKVDRKTGEIIWRLGGKRSDFELTTGTRFAWQHDFVRVGSGHYTVFNNASNGVIHTASQSTGLMLEVNQERKLVTLLHSYNHSPPLLCSTQGSVQVLPSGEVFVGWGSEPHFTQYTVHGDPVFEGSLPLAADSYRAYRRPWSARPSEPPALAVRPSTGGAANVYVSWNGATEVASWTVLAGPSPTALTAITAAPATGFETTIPVTAGGAPYLAVQALDSAGRSLGYSKALKAS
jgi:Arylsulfotransferase (ASST)